MPYNGHCFINRTIFSDSSFICLYSKHSSQTLPKLKGGIGLPELSLYYRASQLTRIVDWHNHALNKDWVGIENAFLHFPISHLPWINPTSVPRTCRDHPLIGLTIANFRMACQSLELAPSQEPMTPVTQNPDFPPDIDLAIGSPDSCKVQARACRFFNNGSLLPHSEMSAKFSDLHIPFFKFLQIRHFFHSTPTPSHWCRALTPFELICNESAPQKHRISAPYALLMFKVAPNVDLHQKWNTDLSLTLSSDE